MNTSTLWRAHAAAVLTLAAVALLPVAAGAEERAVAASAASAAKPALKAAVNKANAAAVAPVKQATGKVEGGAAGTILVKPGDNQYPTGSGYVPPKPKKDALEAAGAAAATKAQVQR